ncbi:MAG: hypothetical protein KKD47_05695, partial [Proteobacteria bacterium]|nr:hypothetical protein [Pseudomonadota bacterium]
MKSNIFSSRALLIFLASLVVLSSGWILFVCLENENPSIKVETPSMTMAIGPSKNLLISVSDGKRGLRKILIAIVKDGKESVLIDKEYPSGGFISGGKVNQDNISLSVEPKKLEITDGKAV